MIYDKSTSVADALIAWDAGRSIWSVEMGGLGPGYEQCIQLLVVELLRAYYDKPLPPDHDKAAWREWGDDVVAKLDPQLQFSGAQVGVAKNLAARMLRIGYGATLEEVQRQTKGAVRLIQISRNFPAVSS